jgi:hypothetical protein
MGHEAAGLRFLRGAPETFAAEVNTQRQNAALIE